MTRRSVLFASLIVMAAMLTIAITVATKLPAGVSLPVHWGLNGQPNRSANKWVALLLPFLIVGLISLRFFRPLRLNLAAKGWLAVKAFTFPPGPERCCLAASFKVRWCQSRWDGRCTERASF